MTIRYTSVEDGQVIDSETPIDYLEGVALWRRSDVDYSEPTGIQHASEEPVAGLPGHEITGGPTHLSSATAGLFPPEFIRSTEAAQAFDVWQERTDKERGELALSGEVRSNIPIRDDKSENPLDLPDVAARQNGVMPTGTDVITDGYFDGDGPSLPPVPEADKVGVSQPYPEGVKPEDYAAHQREAAASAAHDELGGEQTNVGEPAAVIGEPHEVQEVRTGDSPEDTSQQPGIVTDKYGHAWEGIVPTDEQVEDAEAARQQTARDAAASSAQGVEKSGENPDVAPVEKIENPEQAAAEAVQAKEAAAAPVTAERPAGNANGAAWLEYATALGLSLPADSKRSVIIKAVEAHEAAKK